MNVFRERKPLKKQLFIILLVFIIIAGYMILEFGSALFQEGNPVLILTAIGKLELSKSHYERFSKTNTGIRYVSKNTGDPRYDVIKDLMKEKEWEYTEQIGAGLVFEKDGETIVVETSQYSKRYFLWSIPYEIEVRD